MLYCLEKETQELSSILSLQKQSIVKCKCRPQGKKKYLPAINEEIKESHPWQSITAKRMGHKHANSRDLEENRRGRMAYLFFQNR